LLSHTVSIQLILLETAELFSRERGYILL
jgi:hypothetical protein